MWGKLMARLGYERYYAQGGDWGAIITQSMGVTETEHCGGIHTNMPLVVPDPDTMDELTETEQSRPGGHRVLQRVGLGLFQAAVPPVPRPWATAWRTRRWVRWRGLWKSSTPGPTAMKMA